MLKKISIFILLATCLFSESIEYTFGNQSNNGSVYEFDIKAHAGSGGTRLGDALIYLNYSTDGFGSHVVANSNIQVSKGALIKGDFAPELPLYQITNIVDNSNSRVAIAIEYLYDSSPARANELTVTPQPIVRVALTINNTAAPAGLSFENPSAAQPSMQDQQYQSDNEQSAKYNPVLASDTDNSELNPIAADLVSFTATPEQSGILLEWQTASEVNIAGFNIFRSMQEENKYHQINQSLIKSKINIQGANYSYIDDQPKGTSCYYKLQTLYLDGRVFFHPSIRVDIHSQIKDNPSIPTAFKLEECFPNPFNPQTVILYQIPTEAFIDIAVYNLQGQRVRQLVRMTQPPGHHTILWNGKDDNNYPVRSGLYILRMRSGDFQANKRVTLLR